LDEADEIGSRSRSCRHPRRRRHALRRRATKDYEHYFVLVDHWEHSYNFGSGDPRFHETPYSHTETLSWTGRVVLPEYFKYPNAVVAPSARDGMMADRTKSDGTIGSIYARGREINVYVFIPAKHKLRRSRCRRVSGLERVVSTFVEIAPDEYDDAAFDGFDASAGGFAIGNARALMWMAQLAYETHQPSTIQVLSGKWSFSSAIPFSKRKTGLNGTFETCGIIAERPDAVILAFAGTDPGVWQNLATDFNARPTANTDTHAGFELAAGAAAPEIAQATQISRQLQRPLFITGHSLGAALAALAAQMAAAGGSPPRAVYTFGMPRVGGSRFQARYDPSLGDVTYRLVHGVDLVARVPMSSLGFRHVGRLLHCAAGAKFAATQPLSQLGTDEPTFAQQFANIFLRGVNNILSGLSLSQT